MRSFLSAIVTTLLLAAAIVAQDETPVKTAPEKPPSAVANGKYGALERNAFDLWTPKTKKPSPLVVYIHGGGFVNGDKGNLSPVLLKRLLDNGIAVMAINYSLMPQHLYPQAYKDSARAVQFARYNAKAWNIDKQKVSAMGSSAGGLTSLWIGFHDEMADLKSDDPVLRESTRLSSMAVWSAQTTLVADIVGSRVGMATLKHSFYTGRFFGLKAPDMQTDRGKELTRDASPLSHLTRDDPPVWAIYSVADKPQTDETTTSDAIHHPYFGKILKEEMDKLKIECRLRHKDDGKPVNDDVVNFLIKHFKGK